MSVHPAKVYICNQCQSEHYDWKQLPEGWTEKRVQRVFEGSHYDSISYTIEHRCALCSAADTGNAATGSREGRNEL